MAAEAVVDTVVEAVTVEEVIPGIPAAGIPVAAIRMRARLIVADTGVGCTSVLDIIPGVRESAPKTFRTTFMLARSVRTRGIRCHPLTWVLFPRDR
jgi:hypothetical protein